MGRIRHWLIGGAAGLVAGIVAIHTLTPAEAQVKREDLRPGLVASHRDAAKGEFIQLEPTVALNLKVGEAAHPTLEAKGGTTRWEGHINVLRGGEYQFGANVVGSIKVSVAGKEVLSGTNDRDLKGVLVEGAALRLEAGIHPFVADFIRSSGPARVELFWKGPSFMKEPVPYFVLKHEPAKLPAGFSNQDLAERGRFLVEEFGCSNCHQPSKEDKLGQGLLPRQGPDLSKVSERYTLDYLQSWLWGHRSGNPSRNMPQLLSPDDATSRLEHYALAKFLESMGGAFKPSKTQPTDKGVVASIDRGKKLFAMVGCATCHAEKPAKAAGDNPSFYLLTGSASGFRTFSLKKPRDRTSPEQLAAFLLNPQKHDPSGRMPSLNLDAKEAADLANYVLSPEQAGPPVFKKLEPAGTPKDAAQKLLVNAEDIKAIASLPEAQQWSALGQRVAASKGCANCHTFSGQPKAAPDKLAVKGLDALRDLNVQNSACLAPDAAKRGKAPRYDLSPFETLAIQSFLMKASKGPGSPSPAHAARVALQRFNCLACHVRDGEGGLSPELVVELKKYEKPENAETVTPPNLTGVGHKLRASWMKDVLVNGGKARPWMSLRMPQFGEAHVGKLPEALAALEGTDSDDSIHKVEITNAKIQAGRSLVGKSAFGCISCHDLAGVPNSGTRGPDLALTTGRVRYDWYRRWLESAQRMDPGTKMPSVFVDGKSTLDNILGGHADAQAEAMWAYLSLGPTMPLPEGLLVKGGQYVLAVTDKTQWLRTFLPEAGSKAFAVGFPGAISAAFDAQQCRLSFGWTGQFLDAAPVWANRGGAPAKVLGQKFWTAPAGCPWGVTDSFEPPNFAAIAKDPAYGAALPEGKVHTGPYIVQFEGFSTDNEGLMTFRYRLDSDGKTVKISERPEPLRSGGGVGIGRRFDVELPKRTNAWLHVADSDATPKVFTAAGKLEAITKTDSHDLETAGQLLVLPQAGGKALVLAIGKAPDGAVWHLQRQGKSWKVLLRLTGGEQPARVQAQVNVWSAVREDVGVLKELAPGK